MVKNLPSILCPLCFYRMAAKCRIIYESEDDNDADRAKRSRTASDKVSQGMCSLYSPIITFSELPSLQQNSKSSLQHDVWSGLEEVATQGEDVNPMAPSSQMSMNRTLTQDKLALEWPSHPRPTDNLLPPNHHYSHNSYKHHLARNSASDFWTPCLR